MRNNDQITAARWVSFLNRLINSSCSLEELILNGNIINNQGAAKLVKLLASMSTLHVLYLDSNNISTSGWCAFARQKILSYHFSSDELDSQVFIGMAVPVLPRAVEWIGQDATGFNLMYHVTRGILPTLTRMWPTLKESGNYRKRKEVDE